MPAVGAGATGSEIDVISVISVALTPALIVLNTTAEQSMVVPDMTQGGLIPLATLQRCAVIVTKPTAQAGLGIVGARVIDATHIGITFGNFTGSSITPTGGETYRIALIG